MDSNILRRIFFDDNQNWDVFVKKYGKNIRNVVIKEVEKFRNCGNPKTGFKLFVCEGCHDVRRVPFRCKGRFCTTCSAGETEEWWRLLEEDVFQVNHRPVILTIDEGLRIVFLKHRELLKALMDEGARFIKEFYEKKHKVTPGVIMGLHTFGSRISSSALACDNGGYEKERGMEIVRFSSVRDFDALDDGDPTVPPQFSCEYCGDPMYPEYYKGLRGNEYKF